MENKISRRQLLSTVGLAALWSVTSARSADTAASNLAALTTPEQTEGPFYIERQIIRSDVTEGKPGVPLQLEIRVLDKNGEPVPKTAIDIWHCDAEGTYSGFAKMGEMGPPPGFSGFHNQVAFDHPFKSRHRPGKDSPVSHSAGGGELAHMGFPPRVHPSDGSTFLRGTQISDDEGKVRFVSIYPGWYAGRALHIHLKVHTGGILVGETASYAKREDCDPNKPLSYNGGHVSHTGQLFFPQEISDSVALREPYSHLKTRRMALEDDMIFVSQGGKSTVVTVSQTDSGSASSGFIARATLCINPEATPERV